MADIARLGAVAAQTVKGGMSARAGARLAREAGLKFTDANWFKVVGQVRRSLANQVGEASRPLGATPGRSDISTMTTKVATGYGQYATVLVRDKQTGAVSNRHYVVRGHKLQTREAIVSKAIAAMQQGAADNPADYPEQIIGAVYTATYLFDPTG